MAVLFAPAARAAHLEPARPARTSVGHVRQQRDHARPHDGRAQLPLVHRARAGDAPRQDLAALRHERLQQLHVLVVDIVDLVRAELADLAPPEQPAAPLRLRLVARRRVRAAAPTQPAAAAGAPGSLLHRHDYTPTSSKPPSSRSSLSRRFSPSCTSGGSPRAIRRRCCCDVRRVRVRLTTLSSSSTRTMMCRMTLSVTTFRRRSISFISSPLPLITSRT